ncbi:fungal-specific transcription factor domain-containing protein [Triangularia verruculosa]|uniref:Fungal-specific transcription factor domain-containing protein n=1 Tax=Triangularia verruculosa TaxID=2587418 RepID=A0AAN6X711_9PEZI|nr:fungal-specific transcription factor domain-containing protein [Triangularia verruculosa]
MSTITVSSGRRKSTPEGVCEGSSQDRTASPSPSSRSSSKPQIRHRASIACASCRERRIRCVVAEGESECTQCRKTGNTCIIKNDDERRRPISKAYMSSLSNRIALLEEMLKEQGVTPPPAVHPPKTRQDAISRQQQEQEEARTRERSSSSEPKHGSSIETQVPTPPGSGEEDTLMSESEQSKTIDLVNHTSPPSLIDPMLLHELDATPDADVRRLLSARGSHSFDPSAGRIRFFGPTANSHVHGKSTCLFETHGRPDLAQRAVTVIETLGSSTIDYLTRCFWDHYYYSGSMVVDRTAFEAGRLAQDSKFYSPFLHLTLLAIGYRFADRTRDDIKKLAVGSRESTLHREAKGLLEVEIDQGGGVPSVQGMLLLADLEFGVGRDSAGWMYLGIANRLSFDIGLHVDYSGANISETEKRLRRQVMAGCIAFDRQWALILGRPTSIKAQDVGIDLLSKGASNSAQGQMTAEAKTYAAGQAALQQKRFELMELAGKVSDLQNTTHGITDLTAKATEDRTYLYFLALERQFQNWYRQLPDCLAWKPINIKSAPIGFFLLHQQFHTCMILLHRPWAKYGPLVPDSTAAASRYAAPEASLHLQASLGTFPRQDNRASLSRSMCTQHAVRVARIFWQQRQRFDGTKIGLEAIQQAGTAALALMAALAHKSAELDHQSNLKYLQVVSAAIYDMSHAYQPASRMYSLLKTMLADIRTEMVSSGSFEASALLNRFHQGNPTTNMIFGSNTWNISNESPRFTPSRRTLSTGAEEGREAKRRRFSTQTAPDVVFSTMAVFGSSPLAGPTSPQPLPPQENSSHEPLGEPLREIPDIAPESDFDLDTFHASFVDFINSGSKGWATATPTVTTETTLEATPLPTPVTEEAPASTNADVAIVNEESAAQQPADDAIVDMTIEEWLAEPGVSNGFAAIEAEVQHCESRFSPVADTSTLTGDAEVPAPAPETQNDPTIPVTLELGTADNGGIHTMDWLATAPPPPRPSRRISRTSISGTIRPPLAPPETDLFANALAMPPSQTTTLPPPPPPSAPLPMTPVTLDELVQSVEEAVDSARARARDREREKSVAAANKGQASSPDAGRNLSLDYFEL